MYRGKPDNLNYPVNLGYGLRMRLMLNLYGDIPIKELYERKYAEILKLHHYLIDYYLRNHKPDKVLKPLRDLFEVIKQENPNIKLRTIMESGPGAWSEDFVAKSELLWKARYPLVFWHRRELENGDLNTDIDFLITHCGHLSFLDGYNMPRLEGTDDMLKAINIAMSRGILTLHSIIDERTDPVRQYGTGWCCEDNECVENYDPYYFCNLVSGPAREYPLKCSLFSTPCA